MLRGTRAAIGLFFCIFTGLAPSGAAFARDDGLDIAIDYHTLDNGLRVVLSEDHTVPTATVGVYFGVGFRSEPPGRTGFAHLFEHLYFAGAARRGDTSFHAFVSERGGISNASTRLDFTRFVTTVPSNALDALLWAEADRLSAPSLSERHIRTHRDVVRNEINLNVENQPYGGWTLIDLPMAANENWHNAHNFYGDFSDLDTATAADARDFFRRYYTPNNAVLVVAGDFDPDAVLARIRDWFGPISAGPAIPEIDVSEPLQTEEKRTAQTYPLAPQPGLSVGYHMPERGTPEYYAMAIIDQMMLVGDDARLARRLVTERGYGSTVTGGINELGNIFNYDGPMLWTFSLVHGSGFEPGAVLADIDAVIGELRSEPVSEGELRRARAKLLTELYMGLDDASTRSGIVDLLAGFALFDDDPARINRIEDGFEQVTPELILATARQYLRPTNRTVLEARAGLAGGAGMELAR